MVRRSVVRRSVVFMAERCPPGGRLAAGKAMYLGVTVYRIHGTNQPSTAGGPSEERSNRERLLSLLMPERESGTARLEEAVARLPA